MGTNRTKSKCSSLRTTTTTATVNSDFCKTYSSIPCGWILNSEKLFVIFCLTVLAIPPVRLDQNGCSSLSPPCPLNARLVTSLVNNISSYKIQCDDGFELFGSAEVTCAEGKWTSGYCASNVASNRPTNQSSTATSTSNSASTGKQLSHYANDGIIDTCSQTLKELNPFWKIDLLHNHHVTGIRLSIGDADRASTQNLDLEVRVGNNPLGLKNPLCVWKPASDLALNEKTFFSCLRAVQGRYLSIQIIGSESMLRLCEVEVFATDGMPSQRCTPEGSLPEDVVSLNGTCFEFATKSGQTFSGARSQCQARKGDLPTEHHLKPKSPAENLITATLDKLKPTLKRSVFWIGIERDPGFTSRTWRWVDTNLVVKKPNWGKDQPNNYNGKQDCAALDGLKDWTWNDYGCDLDNFHWICVFPPKKCGSPDRKEGTEFSADNESLKIGTILTYKCTGSGYFIDSGDTERKCQSTGLWNGTAPTCKFVDCGDEPFKSTLENGSIEFPEKNSTYFGSAIKYICKDGYTIAGGSGTRTCTKDGKWSGSEPKCLNSVCPPPTEIVNATFVATGKTAGSTVTYTCNAGHVLIGSETLRCELGGAYDKPAPMCKYITCGDLPVLPNGTFTLMNSTKKPAVLPAVLGSVALASCDLNQELNSEIDSRIVCSETGQWELLTERRIRKPHWKDVIWCKVITCGEPEVPQGSFVTGYDFTVGSEIQYHCEEGHLMVGGTEIRRCTLKKEWSGFEPECRFIDCGRAQTIFHGQVAYPTGKTHLDSVVQYSCSPNYKLNGPGERICTPNGVWSGSTPKCEEIRCGFPHLPPNSVATFAKNDRLNTQSLITAESAAQQNLNTSYRIGTVIKLRCERGYVIEGDRMQTCEVGGVWSFETEAQCKFVDCGEPAQIANGEMKLPSNTTHFGSAVIYECSSGYKLVGTSRRLCLENGTWSGYDPHCREITCEAAEATNATIDYTSFQVGGLAKYSCGKGSYLVGEATRQCTENGYWSGKSPSCQFVECPSPPEAANARQFLVNVSRVYSSMVEYHCIPGYSISPGQNSVLTCTEFGKWNPPTPPTCLNKEEYIAVSEQNKESANDSSSGSIVGVILGLAIGFIIVVAVLVFLLWRIRKLRIEKSKTDSRRPETTKGEPMVVFPSPIPSSGGMSPVHQQQQQHYYDNPTVDPIYENLDDYGVTSSSSDMVTINGVAVS